MTKADLYVKLAGGQQVVGGYTLSPFSGGSMGSGTYTFDPLNGNYQYVTNSGAIQINAPTVDCAIDVLITNSGTAGAVTFSGFTVNSNTGEPFTTTNGHKFILSIRRINGTATYVNKALQ